MSGFDIVFRIFVFFSGLGLVIRGIYLFLNRMEEDIEDENPLKHKKTKKVLSLLVFLCVIACMLCLPLSVFVI